ncbi:MAG: hypothetical protein NZ555_04885 [Geminicoccaceae bacterium]|nr:hypothetical protein [Geminicoccaceae bacterium]MCX8102468.1 hypothetical protein [Geminicoccaceae bacterium]MDW8371052.1 hypothetical protein [Geminicoccaceae bacterium]
MSLKPALALAAAALVTATAVFQLKFVVRERERELQAVRRAIEEERWRIRTLAADWAWRTRPERITGHAGRLGLVPARVDRFVRVEDLPDATHLEFAGRALTVDLGDGTAIELRFKPASAPLLGAGRR